MNKFVIIVLSVLSIVGIMSTSLYENVSEIENDDLYSVLENNLFHTINDELQYSMNKLFSSLGLNKTFSDQNETRLLLSMFSNLKQVSEKLYKNYKNIKKASRLNEEFKKFKNDSLFTLDIPIKEIIDEDFQLKIENNLKPGEIELSANSLEIPDDSKETIVLLKEYLTHEQNIELADIEKPSKKIRKIYEKHKQFRRARSRNFKIWASTKSPEFEFGNRRVYNGRQVKTRQYPFIASIHVRNKFICTGNIVSRDFILTAASCFSLLYYNPKLLDEYPPMLLVRIGSDYPNQYGETLGASNFFIHPMYDKETLRHNIALIKVRKHLHLRNTHMKIRRIVYKHTDDNLLNVSEVSLLGWGDEDDPSLSNEEQDSLTMSKLKVLTDINDCLTIYTSKYISDTNFCAGLSEQGAGACQHDIGGPAILDNKLVGIVSFGPLICGTPNAPTAFTNINYYTSWIDSIVKPETNKTDVIKHTPTHLHTTSLDNNLFRTTLSAYSEEWNSSSSSSESEKSASMKTPLSTTTIEEPLTIQYRMGRIRKVHTPVTQPSNNVTPFGNVPLAILMLSRAYGRLIATEKNYWFMGNLKETTKNPDTSSIPTMTTTSMEKELANSNQFLRPSNEVSEDDRFTGQNDLGNQHKKFRNDEYFQDKDDFKDLETESDNYEENALSVETPDNTHITAAVDTYSHEPPDLFSSISPASTALYKDESDLNHELLIKSFVKNVLVPMNSELGSPINNNNFQKRAEIFLIKTLKNGYLLPIIGNYDASHASKLRNHQSEESDINDRITEIDIPQTSENPSRFGNFKSPSQMYTLLYSKEITKRSYDNSFLKELYRADMKTNLEEEIVKRLKTGGIPLLDVLKRNTRSTQRKFTNLSTASWHTVYTSTEDKETTLLNSLSKPCTLKRNKNKGQVTQRRFKTIKNQARLRSDLLEHRKKRRPMLKRIINRYNPSYKKQVSRSNTDLLDNFKFIERESLKKPHTTDQQKTGNYAEIREPTQIVSKLFPNRNTALKRVEKRGRDDFSRKNVKPEVYHSRFDNTTFILYEDDKSLKGIFRSITDVESNSDIDYYHLPEFEGKNATNVEEDFNIQKGAEKKENSTDFFYE